MFGDVYLNEIANAGADYINYISLVDSDGNEVSDRQSVTWDKPPSDESLGVISLNSDIIFSINAGDEVKGWRGWNDDSTTVEAVGDTIFDDPEQYINDGEFTLKADETKIVHEPKNG